MKDPRSCRDKDGKIDWSKVLVNEYTSSRQLQKAYKASKEKPANKGLKGDECFRAICSNSPAYYFNKSTCKYYCKECALKINAVNKQDCLELYGKPDLCEYEKPEVSQNED